MRLEMRLFILLTITILFFSTNVQSANEIQNMNLTPAKNCSDLNCVRNNIDKIDTEIIKLIGLRLSYVEKAGKLKPTKKIHDQARENQIILKVTNLAIKEGYPGTIAAEIYKTLLIQMNNYESRTQNIQP